MNSINEIYTMFIDGNPKYYKDINPPEINLLLFNTTFQNKNNSRDADNLDCL